jgi:hypothetical protein
MSNVKITWKAFANEPFGNSTQVVLEWDTEETPLEICNRVFRETNRYEGKLWDIVEPLLAEERTHTALSIGDEVEVDGETYRCNSLGWDVVSVR